MLALTFHQFHTIRIEHAGEVLTITAKQLMNKKGIVHVRGPVGFSVTRTDEFKEFYKKKYIHQTSENKKNLLSWAANNEF